MSQTLSNFLDLFLGSGELLYFFIVIALCLTSLLMAFEQRSRRPSDVVARRYFWALSGVVVGWVALMIGALVSLIFDENANNILPPLERLSGMVTVLLLSWGFMPVTNERNMRRVRIALLSAVLAVIAGYAWSASLWYGLADTTYFNLSDLGVTWTFAATIINVAGILWLVSNFDIVVDAPLKMVFFAIMLN